MNTKQVITLWYGGLAIVGLLLAGVGGGLTVAAALAVVTLLFVFSFSHHHTVNKHKVMVAVILPTLVLGIASFVMDSTEYDVGLPETATFQSVPAGEVELIHPKMVHRYFVDQLTGEIRNKSGKTLTALKLLVTYYDENGPVSESNVIIRNMSIPPGQTQRFLKSVGGPHAQLSKTLHATYQILMAAGR
ncbi:MAG: FxLYD domain-containing protein [bacterium]